MPRAGAVIIPIDDIGDVAELAMADVSCTKIFNVEIIGILQLGQSVFEVYGSSEIANSASGQNV